MKKLFLLLFLLPNFAMTQHVGLQFDGAGDYIKTAFNGIAGSGSRTVQCWFKGFSGNQMFLVDMGVNTAGNGGRFSVKINQATSVARVEIGTSAISGTVNIANNFWHQITVVYDNAAASNKYKIYVDGVLDVQGDLATTLNTAATSTTPLTIGIRTDLDANTDVFGSMDDVRVWSIPLTAAQIVANYNKEICGTPPGLVAYYKMNEGTNGGNNTAITSLVDAVTPTSNNPLSGFTLTGNTSNYVFHILNVVNNTSTQSVSTCGPYTWSQSGLTYSTSGTYTFTENLYAGCDSVHTLNLTINPIPPTVIPVSTCTNYTWPQTGLNYSSSGSYNVTLTSTAGCDSIVTLNLTITPIAPTTLTVATCTSYNWPLTGQTYTNSGLYADTLLNGAGCDSIIHLNLTINQPTSATVNVITCSNYTWPLNNATYTTSGTHFHTIQNAGGCDSVVQLNLTIGSVAFSTVTVNACSSFTWPANNQTYTVSGVYVDTNASASGCDSIIELTLTLFSDSNLAIDNGNGTLSANISGSTYQWINCVTNSSIPGATNQNFSPTTNGSYAVISSTTNCSDTSNCIQLNNVGITENGANNFRIYPVPTSSKITIESANDVSIQFIQVFDIQGKMVENLNVEASKTVLDMSRYQGGVYHLILHEANGNKSNHRLIKE